MIRKGQKVHILPEYQDQGDNEYEWFAVEDEDGGRLKISPVIPNLSIQPVHVVETRMLVEGALDDLTNEYEAWGKANGFDDVSRKLLSADEMFYAYPEMSKEQKGWLSDFISRWEKTI